MIKMWPVKTPRDVTGSLFRSLVRLSLCKQKCLIDKEKIRVNIFGNGFDIFLQACYPIDAVDETFDSRSLEYKKIKQPEAIRVTCEKLSI